MMIIFSILFWSIWRRVLGGLMGLPRPLIVAFGCAIGVAMAWEMTGSIITSCGAALLVGAFWTPKHDFGGRVSTWKIDEIDHGLFLRYGPVGIAWIVARRTQYKKWTEYAELGAGAIFGALFPYAINGFNVLLR